MSRQPNDPPGGREPVGPPDADRPAAPPRWFDDTGFIPEPPERLTIDDAGSLAAPVGDRTIRESPPLDRTVRTPRGGSEGTLTWSETGEGEGSFVLTLPEATGSGFGKYEILEEIGRGGMGVVYKARQTDLDRLVAIKMILSSHLASPEQVRRFHVEARSVAKLQHPHIVRIHEIGLMEGQHYFAMEYVAGPSLAKRLRAGPLEIDEAVRYVATVARAVEHLHEQGIVHRDLKPSNILLDEAGNPYVTDFGMVKLLEDDSEMTGTGTIVGTPSYMAPEQAAGRTAKVGPLSDVYSLGAILYELLTGRPLFVGESPLDTLVQVMEGEPTRPSLLNPKVHKKLEMICLKCLEKSSENRYESAAALSDDLERFLGGEAVQARRAGILQRLEVWARKEPALASRLGALAIVSGVVQTNYFLQRDINTTINVKTVAAIALWAVSAVIFQWLLRKGRWADVVRLAWAGADVVLLSVILQLNAELASPVVVCYALLVAGSGLWFRVPLVWFTTTISEVGYVLLVLDYYRHWRVVEKPHHHVIFMAVLAVLGFVISYMVQRVRVLSRYYENRPLP